MIKIAITGGIGSGKSTVCKLFNEMGIATFDSDSSAKKQYLKPHIKYQVIKLLGNNILTNNEIDLNKISEICFNDNNILNTLTDIISEGVLEDYSDFLIKNNKSIYTIFESAILINHNKTHLFDKIIGVIADQNTRIKRVMERSKLSENEIIRRINSQVSDNEIMSKCDYIILNNTNFQNLINQIEYINLRIKQNYKI